MVAVALEEIPEDQKQVDPALAQDFLALGYCHLEVELLTRQLRYMSNLDEIRFRESLVAAAQAAVQRDDAGAREHLRGAFDRLIEAREYFYPVETYLLDLTLVAPTTLGPSLRAELGADRPVGLLLTGEVLETMAVREPETLALLKNGLERGTVTLLGGELVEDDLPLAPIEEVLAQLKAGLATYERHLGRRPTIFGRRRFGLTPVLPQILRKLGFEGALHFTLDDGRFPADNQSKMRWEGFDGTEIESLARVPIEATRADAFLRLAQRLGNSMDLDHAATTVVAHWPCQTSPWYGDLRRMARYGPVLGKLASMATYFENTQYAGRTTRHSADKYRSPYLEQEVAEGRPDPISRWVRRHRRRASRDAARNIEFLARACGAPAEKEANLRETPGTVGQGDEDQAQLVERAMVRFASQLPRTDAPAGPGCLLVNPCSYTRRAWVDVSALGTIPALGGPVKLTAQAEGRKQALVEVPSMGYVWLGGRQPAAERFGDSDASKEGPLAESHVLHNEFFEVVVNRTTGAIQSITNYAVRGNRLAQQIGLRLGPRDGVEPGAEEEYSVMAADDVAADNPDACTGRITVRGRLLDRQGGRLAGFTQTLEARRGSRVLRMEIELDIERQPGPEPWKSYYAARFAWSDETAETYRAVSLAAQPTEARRIEAPHYVDIRAPRTRFSILTGGLPYHRRYGTRKLDTLLVVAGETCRSFRLGIGVDLTHPLPAALDLLGPDTVRIETAPPPQVPLGWLFHVDAKNVVATHWEPLSAEDRMAGYRVRLLETEGRPAHVGLRSYRPVASARRINFLGEDPIALMVEDDRVALDVGPHQW
ncbi:MAG: hypothetical protein NUV77_22240, partial [Thermoguttaceae bacterium]|nr:hypothetical protein [Thermoguttaceae bacterium]